MSKQFHYMENIPGLLILARAVYDTVKPAKSSSKFIVALVSIAYGVFAIFIMGGPVGAMMSFFLNPVGFIFVLFIFIVGYMITVISLTFVVMRLSDFS